MQFGVAAARDGRLPHHNTPMRPTSPSNVCAKPCLALERSTATVQMKPSRQSTSQYSWMANK